MSKHHQLGATTAENEERYGTDKEKQKIWLEFSANVVDETTSRIQTDKTLIFKELYEELAAKRHEIAETLGHGLKHPEDRTKDYGRIRTGKHDNSYEEFFYDGEYQPWEKQAPAILEKVTALSKSKNKNEVRVDVGSDYHEIILLSPRPWYQAHHSKFVGKCSEELARITYHREDPKSIKIEYTPRKPDCVDGDWAMAHDYFKDMLTAYDEEEFASEAGRLMHLLGNILPASLGSASIAEWILYSAAASKGYSIKFNLEETQKLGWDFNSLVTPREKYVQWFKDKAVTVTKIQSPHPDPEDPKSENVKGKNTSFGLQQNN